MTGLSIKDLKVGYGRNEVIHGVDIDVNVGEKVALLGANGAGKSTTFAMLTGEKVPTCGHGYLFGRSILSHQVTTACP